MPQQVFLHYFNANVEERLPHSLEFGSIAGRIVTEKNVKGHIVTVVAIGIMPRRYYVWSSFIADQRSEGRHGKSVVHGVGWHLCPPQEISEKNISFLTDKKLTEHLFVQIVDPKIATWLLRKANKFKPPGDMAKLKAFLQRLLTSLVDEKIETKIKAALKALQLQRNPERRWMS